MHILKLIWFKKTLNNNFYCLNWTVFIHEVKELVVDCLIVFYKAFARFLNDDQVSPFFWLSQKIQEIIDLHQSEPVMSHYFYEVYSSNNHKFSNFKKIKKRNYLQLLLEAKVDENNVKKSEITNEVIDYTKTILDKTLTMNVSVKREKFCWKK